MKAGGRRRELAAGVCVCVCLPACLPAGGAGCEGSGVERMQLNVVLKAL